MVEHARGFLSGISLRAFSVDDEGKFLVALNEQTQKLADGFPLAGRGNWGAARKSLNIFLRDCIYSRYLSEHFALVEIEPWLEVPLDSNVYAGLRAENGNQNGLERWRGVRGLTPDLSGKLQSCALSIAQKYGVARVHLDVLYYRRDQVDRLAKRALAT